MFSQQFQKRGTPHIHALVAVERDGIEADDITNSDIIRQSLAFAEIKKRITANLVNCYGDKDDHDQNVEEIDETDFNWKPSPEYFSDVNDPRRESFDPTLDYRRRNDDGLTFANKYTQSKYRNMQLATQIHNCCFTYYKYGPDCRFHFPYLENASNPKNAQVEITRDRKHRKQIKVKPPRNNAHMNSCFTSPLVHLAHGSDCDVQFMQNTAGALEYCASYTSKQDTPDFRLLDNIIAKKIGVFEDSKISIVRTR